MNSPVVIPHSFPNLRAQDKQAVLECFDLEYVGYDAKLDNEIQKKLKENLLFNYIDTTPSASLALLLILKSLNVADGDEVILSAINCWSVFNIIKLEKATPIICDVSSTIDFRVSYRAIKERITSKTKVILVTHMYGALVDIEIIKVIKREYPNIAIIEDFSTSFLATKNYKFGSHSDFAIGSFGSTKPLTGGIGGVLCSHTPIVDTNYSSQSKGELLFLNMQLSRLNQTLLLSQLNLFTENQKMKIKLLLFYQKFISIFAFNKSNFLFRAISFQNPNKLVDYLLEFNLILDIRNSVQPNFAKELGLDDCYYAYNFQCYYSLPLNIKAYEILNKKGLL